MAIVVSKRSNEAVFICKSLGSLGPFLVVDSSVHCPSTPPSSLFLDPQAFISLSRWFWAMCLLFSPNSGTAVPGAASRRPQLTVIQIPGPQSKPVIY